MLNNASMNRIRNYLNNENPLKTRKLRLLIASLALLIIYFLIILIVPSVDKDSKQKKVEQYMNANTETPDILNDFLDNEAFDESEEAYYIYSDNMLGIDNNIALAGRSISSDINANYSNELEGNVAYLDGSTLFYCSNGKKTEIANNADEPILTVGQLYFIDITNESSLTKYDCSSGQKNSLCKNVRQFALYGNYIVFISDNWDLMKIQLDSKETVLLAENIQRFFAGEKIIAQNGTRVISVSLDGQRYEEIIKDAVLEGYSHGKVYYTYINFEDDRIKDEINILGESVFDKAIEETVTLKDGRYVVYEMDLSTGEETVVEESQKMIRAVYIIGDKIVIDTI